MRMIIYLSFKIVFDYRTVSK